MSALTEEPMDDTGDISMNPGVEKAIPAEFGAAFEETPSKQVVKLTLDISPDAQEARFTLGAAPPDPFPFTFEGLLRTLAASGVVEGILVEELRRIVAQKLYISDFLVAKGQKAKAGEDGRLEFLFDQAPRLRFDGVEDMDMVEEDEGIGDEIDWHIGDEIDWHEGHLIRSVAVGQPLVRRIPASPGSAGVTVTGKAIEPQKVLEPALPRGRGIKLSDDDPNLLVAAIDGAVRVDRGRVLVDDILTIEGDINYAIGNVDFHGCVRIRGNVLPGFGVHATGDVHVDGYVEGANIYSGSSVLVAQGVLGRRPAMIQAEKDIRVRIASNAALRAGGDIVVQGEVVNCRLESGGNLIVGTRNNARSRIVGGEAFVGEALYTVDLGAARGTSTLINMTEKAIDACRRELRQIEMTTNSRRELRGKVQARLAKLVQLRLSGELSWSKYTIQLLGRLKDSMGQIDMELNQLQRELEECKERLTRMPGPKVVVYGTMFPSVKIKIGSASRSFNEKLSHVQMVAGQGISTITVSPL